MGNLPINLSYNLSDFLNNNPAESNYLYSDRQGSIILMMMMMIIKRVKMVVMMMMTMVMITEIRKVKYYEWRLI